MTTMCDTPSCIPILFYQRCTGLGPRPRFSRARKMVILVFFPSSLVRNNIFSVPRSIRLQAALTEDLRKAQYNLNSAKVAKKQGFLNH